MEIFSVLKARLRCLQLEKELAACKAQLCKMTIEYRTYKGAYERLSENFVDSLNDRINAVSAASYADLIALKDSELYKASTVIMILTKERDAALQLAGVDLARDAQSNIDEYEAALKSIGSVRGGHSMAFTTKSADKMKIQIGALLETVQFGIERKQEALDNCKIEARLELLEEQLGILEDIEGLFNEIEGKLDEYSNLG